MDSGRAGCYLELHMRAILLVLLVAIAGCTTYQPVPSAPVVTFDRSWNAALDAMREQGVAIASEDRGAGVARGQRGGIQVTAQVRTQADGSVQAEFNTTGETSQDPQLIERISRSYRARIGQ